MSKNLILSKSKSLGDFFKVSIENQFLKVVSSNMNNSCLIVFYSDLFALHFIVPLKIIFVKNLFKFKVKNEFFFLKVVIKYLIFLLKGIHQMFFLELRIVGLGYKAYKYKRNFDYRIFHLKLGLSHILRYILPKNIHLITGKRRILFFTNDYSLLQNVYQHLFFLKKINYYKVKGLIDIKKQIKIKQGKQQQH